jgi:predicted ABC-type ATPase
MTSKQPTIYLIAGCNGAGKTTFAKEFLPTIGVVRFLNADSTPPAKLLAEFLTQTIVQLRTFLSLHEEAS